VVNKAETSTQLYSRIVRMGIRSAAVAGPAQHLRKEMAAGRTSLYESYDSREVTMQQPTTDFTRLDDPQFFEERRHVREKLERLPEHHVDRASLADLYEAMTREFEQRAASAWQQS
jgi:hypothetical protein